MSAILVPSFYDLPDSFNKSSRHVQLTALEENSRKVRSRHHVVASSNPTTPSSPTKNTVFAMQPHKPANATNSLSLLLPLQQQQSREHRKLDRSMSEPVAQPQLVQRTCSTSGVLTATSGGQQQQQQANSSRYKTELCRPFEENGTCKYGDKCQFAHGGHELRTLARHPKYKTELCRTFHTAGFCPYGPRCHFIHNSEETKKSLLSTLQSRSDSAAVQPPQTRPKALSIGSFSLGSAGEMSPPSSLSASPTSLNSFFADDPFFSPALVGHANNHRQHQQQACTAFSFSQDFAGALTKAPLGNHGFGGSQPSLAAAVGLHLSDIQDRDMFSFDSPPSPVDSLSSEIDGLTLGLAGANSPVNCGSPLGLLGPRLPIFSRIATSDSE